MKVIGIDPGLAGTGVGVITGDGGIIRSFAYGNITTTKLDSPQDRLNQIFVEIKKLVESEKPDLMILEDVFFLEKYPKSGILLGKVSGVILLASSQLQIPIREVTVRETKRILTGNGASSKKQLEKAVRSKLNVTDPIRPYHAADALGLALVGLFRY